jgi:hypothetical protein
LPSREVVVRSLSRFIAVEFLAALAGSSGCREAPIPVDGKGGGPRPSVSNRPDRSVSNSEASQKIGDAVNTFINEATVRFRPLDYEYDEDLLQIVDRVEASLSGKASGLSPRAMPKLDEQEEMEHFRETFRRWKAHTGKDLRVEIDKLTAEVAARKPNGPQYYPDFHIRFSAVFDDMIPIEVAEIRERRNRYIHQRAKPLLDSYREKDPEAVRSFDEVLNQPPYNVPPPESATPKKS